MNNLDFLNLNSIRNYPIKDNLSRVSTDGVFTIPNDLIVDLSISAPGIASIRLYISKITNTSTGVYIEISVVDSDILGTFFIPAGTIAETDVYMTASVAMPGSQGILTLGTLDSITQLPSGEYTFDSYGATTELLMRVYTPSTSGVNFISFKDSVGNSTVLTGDVVVQAESNLQFRPDGNTVFIDAGENLGLNKNCAVTATPITSINGVPPDNTGNFTLIPSDCISIDTADFGLIIGDTCGQPCLGCSDISTLTTRLISVESDLLTVRDYVNNLQGLITQLTTLVNYQCQC